MDCSPPGCSCPWDSPGKNTRSGLPFPSPGDLPNPGIEPKSPALVSRFFTTDLPRKHRIVIRQAKKSYKFYLAMNIGNNRRWNYAKFDIETDNP